MNANVPNNDYFQEDRFESIEDFTWAVDHGAEVEFEWKNKVYVITHPYGTIDICEARTEKNLKEYETADEALEYMIDGQKLREIITQVEVLDRTL